MAIDSILSLRFKFIRDDFFLVSLAIFYRDMEHLDFLV